MPTSPRSASRPCDRPSTCIRSASTACCSATPRPLASGPRTTKAGSRWTPPRRCVEADATDARPGPAPPHRRRVPATIDPLDASTFLCEPSRLVTMQPLRGLTVVTLEHAIAAPFATRQLADLGARVIKIERPGSGDFARGYDQRVRGLASHFVWTNRSKESLTLDVKHPEAAKVLERLVVEKADVVVQNLAPGAAARLGLGYEKLSAIKQ